MDKRFKILIIQTAFIGDVILATPVIEAIHSHDPSILIDMLIRKGNEGILKDHPKLSKLWIWDKKDKKTQNQWGLIRKFKKQQYDIIINLQRFMSSGLFTTLSGAKSTIGFDKNPLSFRFTHKVKHEIGKGTHEIDRNLSLLNSFISNPQGKMRLYPSAQDFEKIKHFQKSKYIVIAPTSVWYTKQYPAHKWIDFMDKVDPSIQIYLIGGPDDSDDIEAIIEKSNNNSIKNFCGKLSILQSAALMQGALMNYVNDSAPLHIASAMNAASTAIFCSTTPSFGFGPKSDNGVIIEADIKLSCKPCGLHGRRNCKEEHFDCANKIDTNKLLTRIK